MQQSTRMFFNKTSSDPTAKQMSEPTDQADKSPADDILHRASSNSIALFSSAELHALRLFLKDNYQQQAAALRKRIAADPGADSGWCLRILDLFESISEQYGIDATRRTIRLILREFYSMHGQTAAGSSS